MTASQVGDELQDLTAPLIRAINHARPLYARMFEDGDQNLESYVQGFFGHQPKSLQNRADYIEAMTTQVEKSQGSVIADRLRQRLQRSPVVNTANHLCLECLPLTVQSMIVAALGEDPSSILPVETYGAIPADNLSFPAGLLVSRKPDLKPLRIPIHDLSAKQRRGAACRLPAFGARDLDECRKTIALLLKEGSLVRQEHDALLWVIGEALASSDVLGKGSFAEQAAIVVPRLWEQWFVPEARRNMPALAYVPVESVRTPLLVKDLQDRHSLVARILLDPELRERILNRLDGAAGCWTERGLEGGSAFFWLIDSSQRMHALRYESNRLKSADGSTFALNSQTLSEELISGHLLPTLFANLLPGIARGIVHVGGFNQIEYLSVIQNGIAASFEDVGELEMASILRSQVPPSFTAGLIGLLLQGADGRLRAAGGIELLARGGLNLSDIEQMKRLSLRDAMTFELPNIMRIVLGRDSTSMLTEKLNEKLVGLLATPFPILRY